MNDVGQRDDPMLGPTGRSGDRIETLLRTTGRRPGASSDRADRVEAKVKAFWQADLRRHSRRRWAWAAGALATAAMVGVAVSLGLLWTRGGPSPASRTAARVEVVFDSAWSQSARNTSPVPLRPGDEVKVGSDVATEDRGRTALLMTTGHSLRLDTGTRVTLLSDRVIALDRGAVYVDSRGVTGAAAGSVEIRTPLGTIRDVGTQFEVRWLTNSLRVRVREGRIVADVKGSLLDVAAGHELQLDPNGGLARHDLAALNEDELDWVSGITPMLDIDGRSLQEFLEWIARERGLRLEFGTPDAAASARRITLNGSIRGMTLDQALESVLSTCRMSHLMDGKSLRIEPSKERGSR